MSTLTFDPTELRVLASLVHPGGWFTQEFRLRVLTAIVRVQRRMAEMVAETGKAPDPARCRATIPVTVEELWQLDSALCTEEIAPQLHVVTAYMATKVAAALVDATSEEIAPELMPTLALDATEAVAEIEMLLGVTDIGTGGPS